MRRHSLGLVLPFVLILIGCDSDKNTDTQDNITQVGFFAKFSPSDRIIPFPNNALFRGSVDGTINIPINADTSGGETATIEAMNAQDGFSTVAPISTTFSGAINAASLIPGSTVRVFEVALSGVAGAVVAINRELEGLAADKANIATAEYAVSLSPLDTSQSTLVISPLRPLSQGTSYLIALSKGISSVSGDNATADLIYGFTKSRVSLLSVKPPISVDDIEFAALKSFGDENKDGVIDGIDLTTHLATVDSLDDLREATDLAEQRIEAFTVTDDSSATITDLTKNDIILSWSFTTQTIGAVLTELRADLAAATPPVSSFVDGAVDISPLGLTGVGTVADFYKGSLRVPYYLSDGDISDAKNPLTGFWEGIVLATGNRVPDLQSTQNIPILLSVPKTAKPANGWPTVIFQHGITRDRSLLFGVADYLAAAGYAAISIDLPLHGIMDAGQRAILGVDNTTERTFGLDVVTQNAEGNVTAQQPDGIADSSGLHFINLSSLRTTRDNTRQGAADLFALRFALENMDYDNIDNGVDFNTSNLRFIGYSLGAMIGTLFIALEDDIDAAVLAMPGGGIPKLLDGSAAFGASIAAGLASNGIIKGTADYERFMASAQLVMDSGDPINYTGTLAASDKGLLVLEVVGDGTANYLPDLVVPNKVPDDVDNSGTIPAPLSGTDPFAALLGTQKISAPLDDGGIAIKAWVRFVKGHHGSLVSPANKDGEADPVSAVVYNEMANQITSFLNSLGTQVIVNEDGSLDIIEAQ
ncbi:MAG: hypothetical protein GXP08_18015 [Gammaproteobacteria bacterium]|nr:hypothetical protein [Gammaproteobacteria bacterium]